ncbi:MAG: hypothetical protein QNL88_15775 [Acidobacteriota bacterium]|nr:hypothetical protein [Acidobacteriota bacterium]
MSRFCSLVVIALAVSCAAPIAPPESVVIQNIDLGLALSGLPDGLKLASNQGTSLELRPTDDMIGGILWFAVGPEQEGVNLVAAVQTHQERMEGMPEADYKGGQELQGDFGTAFYSRAQYVDQDERVEETIVFMIHPAGNRLLGVHYRYPAGDDSAARVEQLIDVVSRVETVPGP